MQLSAPIARNKKSDVVRTARKGHSASCAILLSIRMLSNSGTWRHITRKGGTNHGSLCSCRGSPPKRSSDMMCVACCSKKPPFRALFDSDRSGEEVFFFFLPFYAVARVNHVKQVRVGRVCHAKGPTVRALFKSSSHETVSARVIAVVVRNLSLLTCYPPGSRWRLFLPPCPKSARTHDACYNSSKLSIIVLH